MQTSSLLTLPLEVRTIIYNNLLQNAGIHLSISVKDHPRWNGYSLRGSAIPTAIWLVCRKMTAELHNHIVPLLRTTLRLQCADHMNCYIARHLIDMLAVVPSHWLATVCEIEMGPIWMGGLKLELLRQALPRASTFEVKLPKTYERWEAGQMLLKYSARRQLAETLAEEGSPLSPCRNYSVKYLSAQLKHISDGQNSVQAITLRARQPVQIWKEKAAHLELDILYDISTFTIVSVSTPRKELVISRVKAEE